ncbi:hypothetical protein ACP4OV_010273 [Aristida adscensionis]
MIKGLLWALLHALFVGFFCLALLYYLVLHGALVEALWRNWALGGGRHRRRAFALAVRALWWASRALWTAAQLLIRLLGSIIGPAPRPRPQESTEEDPAYEILREAFEIIIWNENSLNQGLKNILESFRYLNDSIQCGTLLSPFASDSSSPDYYHFSYRFGSGNEESSDKHLPFKSFRDLNQGIDKYINPTFLQQLDQIVSQCQVVEPAYQQILQKVTQDTDVISRFLGDFFTSTGLRIDTTCTDASQFTDQSAKRVAMILKIAARLLCVMWKELAEAECPYFHLNLRSHYFAVCARGPVENLIEAMLSISKMTWPVSHINEMLILFAAITDVLPAIQNLPPSSIDYGGVLQQMSVNLNGVFGGIENFIHDTLTRSQDGIICISHPATDSFICYVTLLKNHNRIVQQISCISRNGSSTLAHLLFKTVRCWVEKLEQHSVSEFYTEGGKYKFLLNNLTHFNLEIRYPLQILLHNSEHDEILRLLDSRINHYMSEYLVACWSPVRDCLELNCRRKLHSQLTAFTSKFDNIYNCQKIWVLHPELKTRMRQEIREFIIPPYAESSIMELPERPSSFLGLLCQMLCCWKLGASQHRTTEQFESMVEALFES